MLNKEELSIARSLRLAVVFGQYKQGNLSEEEAIELVSGELSSGNPDTKVDDSKKMKDLIRISLYK